MNHYSFALSEILPDSRLLVFVYVRIGQLVHVVMTLYSDATMQNSQTLLDVQLINNKE